MTGAQALVFAQPAIEGPSKRLSNGKPADRIQEKNQQSLAMEIGIYEGPGGGQWFGLFCLLLQRWPSASFAPGDENVDSVP